MPARLRHFLLATLAATGATLVGAQPTEDVPFITSPDNVTLEMLRVANVGPTDHVIDLGSGDGRIVITAAKRFGATGLGVEIVPDLVNKSTQTAKDAGIANQVSFRVQDLFETDLSPATVVTMYLLPDVNLKLRPTLLGLKPGTRIVSHDWDMGEWKPDQTSTLAVPNKAVGREKSSKVHLWVVPAQVAGLWCGSGPLRGFSLRLAQRFQEVEGTLTRRDRVRTIEGQMQGARLQTQSTRHGSLQLERTGEDLRVSGGDGALALAQGTSFKRASGDTCT